MHLYTQLFILRWCIHGLAIPIIQELVRKSIHVFPGLSLAVLMSFSEEPAPRPLPPAMPASVQLTHPWTFSLFWMPTLLYWFASRSGCVTCFGHWNVNRIDAYHFQVGTRRKVKISFPSLAAKARNTLVEVLFASVSEEVKMVQRKLPVKYSIGKSAKKRDNLCF